ncbi:MAG: sigma-70 family RNA polymerase sigma factor [Clostridia bacterium]|nr:sigma-70 family RNA polymerase sigma factor [Clostridia bacterium]
MYYNKVEICGVNTAKLPTLTSQEKKALLLQVKEGDMDAREKLIDGNLRLVLSVVQRFTNRRENLDDLFQIGCIGLIKAVDHFNTEIDVEFSTYAVPMVFVCRETKMPGYTAISAVFEGNCMIVPVLAKIETGYRTPGNTVCARIPNGYSLRTEKTH